ncbi:MAG: hypothetical protein Q9187_005938 [Circinaria calcarea]
MSMNTLVHNSAESWILHPLTHWILQNAVTIVMVGFTPPASSIRYAVLPPMLAFYWLLQPTYLEKLQNKIQAGYIAVGIMLNILQYIELALQSQWSFETHSLDTTIQSEQHGHKPNNHCRTKNRNNNGTFWERLRFGYFAMFSSRLCGTPYEVKNVPLFDPKDPTYIPSRTKFLSRKLGIAMLGYLIIDFLIGSNPDQSMNPTKFSAANVPLLMRIKNASGTELAVRSASVLTFWVVCYCFLQVFMAVCAIARVACGLDEVKSWRPMFGSLSEAYSIRRFWG